MRQRGLAQASPYFPRTRVEAGRASNHRTKGTLVNTRSPLIVGLVALGGVALIVIAIVYWIEPASSLPSFFPGHVAKNAAEAGHHHIKHGIAAFFVGLAALVFAWFQTGKKKAA